MRTLRYLLPLSLGGLLIAAPPATSNFPPPFATHVDTKWKVSARDRPAPPVVTPGTPITQDKVGTPPSDAIVLFNGRDLSNWRAAGDKPAAWNVGDGYFQTTPGVGDIH